MCKFLFSLPPVTIPELLDMKDVLLHATIVAVVIFAINISLAKAFAKKNNYAINVNQVGCVFLTQISTTLVRSLSY